MRDLDGDGVPEIILATLPFLRMELFRPPSPLSIESEPGYPVPGALHCLRRGGGELPGWPFSLGDRGPERSSLADVDGDGAAEVLLGEGDLLHALTVAGTEAEGFPIAVKHSNARYAWNWRSLWQMTDFDADGRPEFVQARSRKALGDYHTDPMMLRFLAERAGGTPVRGFPFTLDELQAASQPVVADLTGDGIPEIAILSWESGEWRLLAWDMAKLPPVL